MESIPIKKKDKLGKDVPFKISRFKEIIKKTTPHKHEGYFELIFLYEGAGFHWVDTEKLQVEPPVAYFLSPGQLHCWELTTIPKGFVLLFREEFFNYVRQADILGLIRELEATIACDVANNLGLQALFLEIEKEQLDSGPYSYEITQGLIQVILARLLQANASSHAAPNTNHKVYHQFRQIIREGRINARLKVKQVAGQLNISPQNLNAVCRQVAGKSASSLMREQILLEAKRYLLHSDLTVSEVAFQLNFSDPSHFVKFFKKSETVTPAQFRTAHFR
ncbi:helix-turn-helix domain-containing protein [Pontibacter sp. 172403-2]|uniref:helix-turn-helix domain-containing protein n=1 Tax=Pontibacter rufus TaxID=2791028 RepID=UPI0018AFAD25|nr:AraC family transcriptional regulator [Pontibacter sp. 172403-2]MBF9252177.1 helix-turn-helix domain-containing protein [Pontibacter sp. 172403-2]